MPNFTTILPEEVSRRSVLKWCAAVGGLGALGSGSGLLQAAAEPAAALAAARIVTSSCNVNCGSRCVLRAHVSDGAITSVETDNSGTDEWGMHQIRACLRGRSMRQRVYAPERLKYPMIRTGKRGEAKFRRASWDEALDRIAGKMKDIKARFGNEAFYLNYGTGSLGGLMSRSNARTPLVRMMNCFGGYLNQRNTYSTAQINTAMPYLYGATQGNAVSDMVNSRLVVMFGNNPANTRMSGGGIIHDLIEARQRHGFRLIVVDPCFSDTAAIADEWIAIRPGTDGALVAALAHVLIGEGLIDQAFLDNYCVGFDAQHMPDGMAAEDCYKAYIEGEGPDGQAKTPAWAAPICGISAERIVKLAREIGQARPCCINQGWGPQRHSNGEDACRSIAMLAILTGNVGIAGGNSGARESGAPNPFESLPTLRNPVSTALPVFLWTDAIERGTEMTALADGITGAERLKAPVKFIWNYAGNALINQHSDINRTAHILADDTKCEMIVVVDNFMTSSARFADILLPGTTNLEENDFALSDNVSDMAYVVFAHKAIEPLFESRGLYEICSDLAERLGIAQQFTEGRSRDQWLEVLLEKSRAKLPDLPKTLDEAWETGIFKIRNSGPPPVAFKAFREDPVGHPLKTPSGKIEIFSKRLWDMAHSWTLTEGDQISAIPVYYDGFEGYLDPRRSRYPLQMISHHYKQRTHSTYGNVPWLKEVAPQELWINPIDAAPRGIKPGDKVKIFNDRGASVIEAKVTDRIIPGTVSLPEGAWYAPDEQGVDRGGCPNILTSARPSPLAKGNPQHSTLVDVAKA